jgi:hypothetical protein
MKVRVISKTAAKTTKTAAKSAVKASRVTKKATATSKATKRTSVGSIAPNLHEGSRSEYLAQYILIAIELAPLCLEGGHFFQAR